MPAFARQFYLQSRGYIEIYKLKLTKVDRHEGEEGSIRQLKMPKLAVNLVILIVFGGSLYSFIVQKPYWPFVPYLMFANIHRLTEPRFELQGESTRHELIPVQLSHFYPYHREEVNKLLWRARKKGPYETIQVLNGLKRLYNREAALKSRDILLTLSAFQRQNRASQDRIKVGTSD